MGHRVRIVRPDDLLNLEIEALNLDLDATDPAHPALVPTDAEQPSFLIVTLPPQAIGESASFEVSPVPPPPDQPIPPDPGADPPPPPGSVSARLGGPTRLVFRIEPAPQTRVPYSLEGLLHWSRFGLSVSPIADVPERPSGPEIDNAPGISEPKPTETAIELPYRLVLSPRGNTAWRFAKLAVTRRGWTELWHARLALRNGDELVELQPGRTAPLRAIWTPGFDPSRPPSAADMGQDDPDLGITAMSPSDRRQIVVLTSAFRGYVHVGRAGDQVPFVPEPIQAERLMLTPLGGWLRSRGSWDPPIALVPPLRRHEPLESWDELLRPAGTPPEQEPGTLFPLDVRLPFVPADWGSLGDPLNLSEWVHVATQGRDHYVRIVYDGCLFGTKHPASLVKVTERRFRDVGGTPVAYLIQHMFVVVRQPEVEYPGNLSTAGREMPLKRIELTTRVTPPIAHPKQGPGAIPGTDYSFWIMTKDPGTGSIEDFRFHAVAQDVARRRIDFSCPLIFVPAGEHGMDAVRNAYRTSQGGQRRAFVVPGQKVTFADPSGPADNTTHITESIYLDPEVPTGKVVGECPFRPRLEKADIRMPAVEQLLGVQRTATIAFNAAYLNDGFVAGSTGVFADIVGGCKVEFPAAKAGGIATPNLDLTSLSREFGPLAGDVSKAASGQFDPSSFFPAGTAQLFGAIDLANLIAPGTIGGNAPKLQIGAEAGGRTLVTTFDWSPELVSSPVDVGILRFQKGPTAALKILGRLEKRVGSPGSEPHSLVRGELTDFTVSFAQVIVLRFSRFAFTSESGQKLSVDVRLAADDPVSFEGDLDFVEELRKAIPPGLFGDGPSLDVDATRVRAGFGISLPPLEVGLFALKDVALSTSLELPFADGKPRFDFSFSERHQPFQLAVALFGGGGFFHLQLDTGGIRQLEAALEFGVVAALDLGVASGSVHYMAGIYFAMNKDQHGKLKATIAGYLRCGGELTVLGIISVSVEFNLTLAYEEPKVSGRATLTVEVEVACFSKSVELTVERKFGKSSGDPKFAELFDSAAVWETYAGAFA